MKTVTRRRRYTTVSKAVSRPVRQPGEREARWSLARDLCRGQWGVNEQRALRIAHLPLMDVALDGVDGITIAQARDWRKVA